MTEVKVTNSSSYFADPRPLSIATTRVPAPCGTSFINVSTSSWATSSAVPRSVS